MVSRRLRRKIKFAKRFLIVTFMAVGIAVTLGIIYVCLTSDNDVKKLNECLQTHTLNYCNKEVK